MTGAAGVRTRSALVTAERNYMRHNNLALITFSREPNPTVFQKTLAVNDFYGSSEHWQGPIGYIQTLGKSDGWQVKGGAPPGLGWAPRAPYGEVARHSIDFWLTGEDIPRADSRVTLRPGGVIRLVPQPGNNTEGLTRFLQDLPGPRPRQPSNDIAATHSGAQVASLDATGAALARHGTPLADDIVFFHEGTRAALVSGPDGHRFLAEEAVRGKGLSPAIKNLAKFLDASSQPDEGAR